MLDSKRTSQMPPSSRPRITFNTPGAARERLPELPSAQPPVPVFRAALRCHLPVLDGLRGVAILMVLCFHLTQVLTLTPASARIDRAIHAILAQGWMGVDLFFVLSGLLITGILIDAKGSPHYFRNFYMRRILRIFPLYYAVIAFYLIVFPRIAPSVSAHYGYVYGKPILYWLYASNHAIAQGLSDGGHGFLGVLAPTWSLAVEEQFYLCWPLVVYFLSRRGLLRACPIIIAGVIVIRIALLARGVHWAYVGTLAPCRLDALAIGGLVACLIRRRRGLPNLARLTLPVSIIAVVSFLVIGAIQHHFGFHQGQLRYAFGYTFLAILAACLMLRAITTPRRHSFARLLTHPWLMAFGKYSYAMYLLHMPLQEVIRRFMIPVDRFPTIGGSQLPGLIAHFAVSLALYFAVAWLSWHLYEKQFLKLKRFFPMRGARTRRNDANTSARAVPVLATPTAL